MNTFQPREEVCTHCGDTKDAHVGMPLVCPQDVQPIHIERRVCYRGSAFGAGNTLHLDGEGIAVSLLGHLPHVLFLDGKDYLLTITEVPQ